MSNFKSRIIIFLFCSIFAAGIGVKINDVRRLCSRLDKVTEPSIITQSHFDHYFAKNIEFHHNCKFSRTAFQDELVQLKKISRNLPIFETGNTEKINDLYGSFLSLIRPSYNSYSAIPILLQKESFLS